MKFDNLNCIEEELKRYFSADLSRDRVEMMIET